MFTLKTIDGLCWSNERTGILVIHPERKIVYLLQGLEECLWDWIQTMPWDDVIELCTLYLHASMETTLEEVTQILKKWQEAGIIHLTGEEYD